MRSLLSLMTLLVTACVKPAPPPQAAAPTTTAIATVVEYMDSTQVAGVPEAFSRSVGDVLAARNLPPRVVPTSQYAEGWARVRSSRHRLEELAGMAGDAELLLLVEAHAEYYSQLNGQYRWVVRVNATLSPAGDLDAAQSVAFDVPVFLFFYHEKDLAALESAIPVIERRVAAMVDDYLGGLGG